VEKTKSAAEAATRPVRDRAYRQALLNAQAEYPDDPTAQHRAATRIARRAVRIAAAKKKE
jgi:hypothetical protein